MYSVTYIEGNGYHCSCCRQASRYNRKFDTLEQAAEFAARINFLAEDSSVLEDLDGFVPDGFDDFHYDNDYELVQIYHHGKRMLNDPEVQKRIAEWNSKIEMEVAEARTRVQDMEREERRRQYEILKAEFEEGSSG